MDAVYGVSGIPRYWITLGREIIWDYPKQLVSRGWLERHLPIPWLYANDISKISCLIREYLDTPRSELLTEPFKNDTWGIANIFRAADRRVGSRQWDLLEQQAVSKIIAKRKLHQAALIAPLKPMRRSMTAHKR